MNFNNRQIWKAGKIGRKCISWKDLKRTAPATIAFVCIVYHDTGSKEREIFRHEAFFSNTWARRRRTFVDWTGYWNKAIIELRYNCQQSSLIISVFCVPECSRFLALCPCSLTWTYSSVVVKFNQYHMLNQAELNKSSYLVFSCLDDKFIRNYLLFIPSRTRTRRLLTQVLMIMLSWINRRKRRRKKMKMLMLPLTNRKNPRRWVAAMFYMLITIR